ncbi:transcription termination factor Rho, partial [Mycobacteroides abscessus subsp. massiliense]
AAQSQQPQASSAPAEAPQKESGQKESGQKESAEPTQTALDLPAEAPKPVAESTQDSEGKKAENGAAPREGRGERRRNQNQNQNQNQPAEGERKQN